jgi:hypothetical protein
MITHFVCLTIYFITRMHPCQSKYHTFCLAAVYVSHSVISPIVFPLGNHDDRIWRFCVFSPVPIHLGCITLAPVVHFKISPLHIHLNPCTASIVMVCPKRHITKEVTQKVASTHSPPTAPDVAKKRKPPKIRNDIPWSPTKVVRRKLAPSPNTTIDLTHSKETSPLACFVGATAASTNTHSKGTSPPACSVAAAASTNLYRQLYSADSADNKDNNDKDFNIHKHINNDVNDDYDDILDMSLTPRKNSDPAFQRTGTAANSELRGVTSGLM